MNTKLIIATVVAGLSLAPAAFAEGEGVDPFPLNLTLPSVTLTRVPRDVGSAAYPTPVPALSTATLAQPFLPPYGGEGAVQSANSLPAGFDDGTVQYADAQSVNRYLAEQAEDSYAAAPISAKTRPNG
ncbi:MAG: hypothetical protein WDN49_15975 [Acetobacteraceae bacterium]